MHVTFIDRRIETRPSSGEAPFRLEEVFFSRTDERGILMASNYVFHRVAGYEWKDMLGAPHKLIRHPDMPKGVFWLLWDTLQKGRTMGAYIKNRAKDGLYYWVYAVIVPCEGGYLSARLKPSSQLRDQAEQEYASLLKAEQEEGLTPEESAARLVQRFQELGFEKYHHYAAFTLSQEMIARDAGLGRTKNKRVAELRNMVETADQLTAETQGLVREFEAMRTIPHNLRVIASRLEPTGGPVTTLSQNYGAMSREMSDWFATHVLGKDSNFLTIKGTVNHSMFLECMTCILAECDEQLNQERRKLGEVDLEAERARLGRIVATYVDKSKTGLDEVIIEANRILKACEVMKRHILGLNSTRILCKIESARLPVAGEALTDIITQLGAFQERITAQLERIAQLGNAILSPAP